MHIDVEIKDGVCTIRLTGRSIIGSDAAYAHTRQELEAAGCRTVIVDCRAAPYLDAAAIGFIADLYKSLKHFGGELVLANANPLVREVLNVTRLDGLIPIFDEEDTALAALAPGNRPPQPGCNSPDAPVFAARPAIA